MTSGVLKMVDSSTTRWSWGFFSVRNGFSYGNVEVVGLGKEVFRESFVSFNFILGHNFGIMNMFS